MECMVGGDPSDLDGRIASFLSDRGCDAVTGIRRMGREALVGRVLEVALSMGIDCRLSDDATDDTSVIVFTHWHGMDEDSVRGRWPDADIMYGQDLCHQVPAVVRLR